MVNEVITSELLIIMDLSWNNNIKPVYNSYTVACIVLMFVHRSYKFKLRC